MFRLSPQRLGIILLTTTLLTLAFRPALELFTLSARLADWNDSELSADDLEAMFDLAEFDPTQGRIRLEEATFLRHTQTLLDEKLLDAEGEYFQYYPPQAHLRIAWYENIINAIPEFADNAYRYAYGERPTQDAYFAYLATHVSRDPDNLKALWDRFGNRILDLVPAAVYRSTDLSGYTQALLSTYADLHNRGDFEQLMRDIDRAEKTIDPDDWASNISEGLYRIFEPFFASELVSQWRRDEAMLDHDDYNEVVWFYSFWLRRWREGNVAVVYQILLDINAHYDKAGEAALVLTPTLGDLPDLSDEARMIFEDNRKLYYEVEDGKRKFEDLNDQELAQYSFFEERVAMFDQADFYAIDPFYVGGCASRPTSIYASTTLPSQGENDYQVSNLVDLSLGTAWVEGVVGNGLGQSLVYRYDLSPGEQRELQALAIHNGYVKSQTAWQNNGRVKAMKLFVNGQLLATLQLEDVRNVQVFDLKPLVRLLPEDPVFRFEIQDVYPGDKYQDVAISELNFGYRACQCLGAGAQVRLPEGATRAIEAVQVGDVVWGVDPATGRSGPAEVLAVASPWHTQMWQLRLSDGHTLTLSSDHPVWTEAGWQAVRPQMARHYRGMAQVATLQVGDQLPDGRRIEAIESLRGRQQTYTLTRLSGGYTAFVADGLWIGVEDTGFTASPASAE